ncbi:ABC transporter substrate-binding protein [Pyrofollis japonicus]|uniref:ABC transporter substrate-binding protein n=1 Tax=Pyrofollis japonicus TaxID=3060460 RepID=UPI00295BE14D|nr:extracellular solute-binding protein [Pyrofollis japonicus]BEP18657.1 ABC transporter substrate-binding protein [Pyrofollis japonicus]
MSKRKLAALVALGVIAVAIVVGVFLFKPEASSKEVVLKVVTRLSPEEQKAIKEAFLNSSVARKYNIKDIVFTKVDYSLWPQLATSGKVDLFLIGEKIVYDRLCKEGVLAPFSMKELVNIVNELDPKFVGRDKNGDICWVAIGQAVYGYIVNKKFLSQYSLPEPQKWGSLLDPAYLRPLQQNAYTVSFPRPTKSGTARTTMHGILQIYGWDDGWRLLTVIGMESAIVDSSEKARDQAAEGIVGIAPAYIGYGIEAEKLGKGAVFEIPHGEGIAYISPAAIAKKAPHPREAQAFILWLLSPEGQETVARLFYYLPVRNVVKIPWVQEVYEKMKGNIFNYNRTLAEKVDLAATTYFEAAIADSDANALLKEIGVKAATLLSEGKLTQQEWMKIVQKLAPLTIKDPWTGKKTQFTLEYAMKINDKLRDNAARDKLYNAIKQAAIETYKEVLKELQSKG